MQKIIYLIIISLTLLFTSCENDGSLNSNGTALTLDDLTKPTLTDNESANILLTIYTMDNITPEGNITADIKTFDYSTSPTTLIQYKSVTLTSTQSDITGTTLYKGWVELEDFANIDYWLEIKNSQNSLALGLGAKVEPWWRELDGVNGPLDELDATAREYEYNEIIRNWENSILDSTYNFNGSATYEDGTPAADYNLTAAAGHWVGEKGYYIEDLYTITQTTSDYSIDVEHLNILTDEPENYDYIAISVEKDFFTSSRFSVDYSAITSVNTDDMTLLANKEVTFNWSLSSDGIFNKIDVTKPGFITTVRSWDFIDSWDENSAYNKYLTHLETTYPTIELSSNLYDMSLTSDANLEVASIYIYQYDGDIRLYGSDITIAEVISTDYTEDSIDVTELEYSYAQILTEGNYYVLKTDIGVYGLIQIDGIHTMTLDEMVPFL